MVSDGEARAGQLVTFVASDTSPDNGRSSIPADTAPEVHHAQSEIYRRMGGSARLAIAFELSQTVRDLALAGIRARHPHYSDADVLNAWAALTLGNDVVRQLWPDREPIQP